MNKMIKCISLAFLTGILSGCCICSRSWKFDKEITGHVLPASGTYHYYTNGVYRAEMHEFVGYNRETGGYYTTNKLVMVQGEVYKYCSNSNGPWKDSELYPATRLTLNALSFMSYSSAASGDYMLGIVIIPCYPFILCELPVQFVLDTVLIPLDWWMAPTTPTGYKKVF